MVAANGSNAAVIRLLATTLLAAGCHGFVSTGLARALAVYVRAPVDVYEYSSPISVQRSELKGHHVILTRQRATQARPLYATASRSTRSNRRALMSASAFVLLDIFFRRAMQAMSVSFPSSLAGCGVLFASMLALPKGDKLFHVLNPGSALLAKWLPLFFVPSLVTLPLSSGLGSAIELAKIALVVIGGFYFTLLTTALSVLGVRKLLANGDESLEAEMQEAEGRMEAAVGDLAPTPKLFSDTLAVRLQALTAATGAAAWVSSTTTSSVVASSQTPLVSAYLLSTTLCTFVFGARLPNKFTKMVHPLVTCTALTWLSAKVFGLLTNTPFRSMLVLYRKNKLSLTAAGAGDILLFLLGPAVVSLACQMYDRRRLMRENIAEVGTAVSVSALGGLFGTAAAVRVLDIGNPLVRLALLSRNITSPLAMAIAGILGADVSLAVSMVVVTGLIGANFGASILDAVGIKDAVARGLGIGAAAHGLGTAAFANDKDAFPFAAIAMALTASACTVLVSVPIVKRLVLQLALGV